MCFYITISSQHSALELTQNQAFRKSRQVFLTAYSVKKKKKILTLQQKKSHITNDVKAKATLYLEM